MAVRSGPEVLLGVKEQWGTVLQTVHFARTVCETVLPGQRTSNNAAGEVLTAKQAPHRPGTAPALGLRSQVSVWFLIPQTALHLRGVFVMSTRTRSRRL